MSDSRDPRMRVLALLQRHGHGTTSFQALEPGLAYWFDDADEACVAYADVGGAYVAAGAPIAEPAQVRAVALAFMEYAAGRGKRVRFFAVEDDRIPHAELQLLHMGEEPVWRPHEWPAALQQKRSLREQLRRARAKGVIVRAVTTAELQDPDSDLRRSADQLVASWQESRPMAPMSFVVQIDLYSFAEERQVFVAERAGAVVGVLAAVPIYARNGWFFEDVLRHPEAPNGTMELLFDHAMRAADAAGIEHVTYGLAPLANTPSRAMATIRDHTRWLYHFDGLRAFKAKLLPSRWQPIYLAFPQRERGVRAVLDTLTAFAGGSLVRFGWHTLRHHAPLVTRVLAWLLVPWTLAIALSSADWFPSPAIKYSWIAYDVVLFIALSNLGHRWRRPLAVAIAVGAALDALLGTVQAALYNIPRMTGPLDATVVALSLAAPLFAAVFLWSSRDHAGQASTELS